MTEEKQSIFSETGSRIKGSFLGLAYGDVLGCPVENYKKEEISHLYGNYVKLPSSYPVIRLRAMRKDKRARPLGLHSDDTQQSMALINIILDGGWSQQAWKEYLVEGMKNVSWRGYGRNFSDSVSRLQRNVPNNRTGSASAGIGAAMRTGPLGALYLNDDEGLQIAIIESTLMTHGDIRAVSIAYAVAWVSQQYVLGKSSKAIASELAGAVRELELKVLSDYKNWSVVMKNPHEISEGLNTFFSKEYASTNEMRVAISTIARPLLNAGFTRAHVNQGFALLGGLHALALSILDEREPNEILLDICRQGYDTDTVAAIAGSILGAKHGIDWIPVEVLIDKDRIQRYANCMVSKHIPEEKRTFLFNERNWTKLEKDFPYTL